MEEQGIMTVLIGHNNSLEIGKKNVKEIYKMPEK